MAITAVAITAVHRHTENCSLFYLICEPVYMQNTNHLIIFARAPVYGRVKQRLARDIGKSAAYEFYHETLTALIARLRHGPWKLTVSVATPGDQHHEVFNGIETSEQPFGDLGVRMKSVLNNYTGCQRIIIGSDIPGIEAEHVQRAFALLSNNDLVFGPATDGGFWLIGCSATQSKFEQRDKDFMNGVRWSGCHALADTLKTLPPHKKVATACTLSDVDDLQAYQQYCRQRDDRQRTEAI